MINEEILNRWQRALCIGVINDINSFDPKLVLSSLHYKRMRIDFLENADTDLINGVYHSYMSSSDFILKEITKQERTLMMLAVVFTANKLNLVKEKEADIMIFVTERAIRMILNTELKEGDIKRLKDDNTSISLSSVLIKCGCLFNLIAILNIWCDLGYISSMIGKEICALDDNIHISSDMLEEAIVDIASFLDDKTYSICIPCFTSNLKDRVHKHLEDGIRDAFSN